MMIKTVPNKNLQPSHFGSVFGPKINSFRKSDRLLVLRVTFLMSQTGLIRC